MKQYFSLSLSRLVFKHFTLPQAATCACESQVHTHIFKQSGCIYCILRHLQRYLAALGLGRRYLNSSNFQMYTSRC